MCACGTFPSTCGPSRRANSIRKPTTWEQSMRKAFASANELLINCCHTHYDDDASCQLDATVPVSSRGGNLQESVLENDIFRMIVQVTYRVT